MNIISRCQTHFCLIPYNINITISSSRLGWRSTRLHKISPMLVTPTVFCGTRSSSLFHHLVLLTRSPQILVAFLLTKTSSCYQKVICWLEASFFPIIENGCGPIFQMDWGSFLDCKNISNGCIWSSKNQFPLSGYKSDFFRYQSNSKFEFHSSAHLPLSFLTSSIMSDRAQNRYKQFEISNLTGTWTCQHGHHQHNNQISTNLYSLFQIYIQLCKQCSENPRRESLRRG